MKKFVFYISRFIIGLVFIIAAIPKIADPLTFAKSIEAYQIIPLFLVNITALILPWIELLIGIFMLIGFLLRGSSLLSIFLFIAFSIMIAVTLIRGLSIDCGCFGNLDSPLTIYRLIEDLILLGFAVYVYLSIKKGI